MPRTTKQSRTSRAVRERDPVSVKRPSTEQAEKLEIYDTTLRDGAQAEDVSFSAEDKVLIAQTVIHITFLLSAMAIAATDRLMPAAARGKHTAHVPH